MNYLGIPNQFDNLSMAGVTTALRPGKKQLELAVALSRELGIPLIARQNLSLDKLINANKLQGIVVVGANRVSFFYDKHEFFFHPGLAKLRIKEIKTGKTDQMIKAMDLNPGDTVLDCTLGLGADAVVASFIVGSCGRVVGVESSLVIASLVRHGMSIYRDPEDPSLEDAISRVEVVYDNHNRFLFNLQENSYDVVFFDPMFRAPKERSSALMPLRPLANTQPLHRDVVEQALKVAQKRVVIKERRGSSEFTRLGFTSVEGGRYAPVAYGVIDKRRRH